MSSEHLKLFLEIRSFASCYDFLTTSPETLKIKLAKTLVFPTTFLPPFKRYKLAKNLSNSTLFHCFKNILNFKFLRSSNEKEKGDWDKAYYEQAVTDANNTTKQLEVKEQALMYLTTMHRDAENHKLALKTLMQVYQEHHRNIKLNWDIAEYLIEIDSAKLAVPFLEKINSFSHSAKRREKAEKLLEKHDLL